jgi:hypothetical protein
MQKFLRGLEVPLNRWINKQVREEAPPLFGGKAGEPVPEVDPEDLKRVWQVYDVVKKEHPGEQFAIDQLVIQQTCKPGANVRAVSYRAGLLGLILMPIVEGRTIAGEKLAPWIKDGQLDDAVFHAAAQVPMEWMGVGIVTQGPPFDVDELVRRVRERQGGEKA